MKRRLVSELNSCINDKVNIQGWVYKIRKLKSISFVILRDRSGLVQCIVDNSKFDISNIRLESVVSVTGEVKESNNKLNFFEIVVEDIEVINNSINELPIEVNKEFLECNLDTMLSNRVLSLRHPKVNAIFKVQNEIVNGFREFLNSKGFIEIRTPKIVKEGA